MQHTYRPRQRIDQSFTKLIHFEVLVPNSLLIDSDALNCKISILFGQPTSIHLIIGNNEKEYNSDSYSQQTSNQENDLPTSNGCAVLCDSFGNTVCNQASEDLRKAIKGEPYTGS